MHAQGSKYKSQLEHILEWKKVSTLEGKSQVPHFMDWFMFLGFPFILFFYNSAYNFSKQFEMFIFHV